METTLLLPHRFKLIGWIGMIISTLLWIYILIYKGDIPFLETTFFTVVNGDAPAKSKYFSVQQINLTYTLTGILFIAGSLLVAFSREKMEDEFIAKLRLSSFQWAVLVNYLLLLAMFLFVYGTDFLTVMLYNMFTSLILFIARFNYLLLKNRRAYEK